MSYNWCHNPDCHKIETQSRVRGSGDNKVLRTIKINTDRQWSNGESRRVPYTSTRTTISLKNS